MSRYLYGTPSENGNIGLRSGNTVTRYTGAVLPPSPESDLPYAAIVWNFDILKTRYTLCFFSEYEYYIDSAMAKRVLNVRKENAESYEYIVGESTGWESISRGINKTPDAFTWTNFDTTYEDGTVAHPASDPIPVTGPVGYLYNGEFSTALPDGVTESEAVPVYDPVPVSPVQINPALLVQGFMVGQAVRRSQGK